MYRGEGFSKASLSLRKNSCGVNATIVLFIICACEFGFGDKHNEKREASDEKEILNYKELELNMVIR